MGVIESIKSGKLIRGGILLVLAVSPLPFGSVQTGVFFTIEIFILFLFLLWILRVWLNKTGVRGGQRAVENNDQWLSGSDQDSEQIKIRTGHFESQYQLKEVNVNPDEELSGELKGENGEKSTDTREWKGIQNGVRIHRKRSSGFTINPLFLVLSLLVLLITFQLLPLPVGILDFFSPHTHQMTYSELSDMKNIQNMERSFRSESSAVQRSKVGVEKPTKAPLKSREDSELVGANHHWLSLSLNPYNTKLVLYKILAYCLILFLVIKNVERYDQVHKMIYVVIFMGVFQAVYGLIDFFTGHNYIFFYQKVYGGKLVTGTFINRNHLAGYLEMVIPFVLAFCLDKIEKKKHDRRENWRDKLLSLEYLNSQYVFLLFLVAVMAFALLFSMSRMGIIGLFIALALMGLALSWHQKSSFHKKVFMVVVAVMVLLGILAGVVEVIARFEGLSGELEYSGARLDVWKDTIKMIRDYPWFGVGAGNFSLLFHKYNSVVDSLFYDHVHNDYLEILVEGGLVGMLMFLVGATYFAVVGLRFLKKEQDSSRWTIVLGGLAGIIAITLHGITDFNIQIPANAVMFFFLLGLTYRIMAGKLGSEEARRQRKRRGRSKRQQ